MQGSVAQTLRSDFVGDCKFANIRAKALSYRESR